MPHPRSPLVKNKGEVYGSRNELVILIAVDDSPTNES